MSELRADDKRRRDAAFSAGLKTIPNNTNKTDLTATTQVLDLSNIDGDDLRGAWIELQAIGGRVTVQRGDHTLTDGVGLVLADGETVEYFVEQAYTELHEDDHKLSIIAADTTPDLLIRYSKRKPAAA